MAASSTSTPSALSITSARPITSSPTRLARKFIAKGIFAALARSLSQILDKVAECCPGYPVAKKSLLVAGFEVVTVCLDRRKIHAAMGGQGREVGCLTGHESLKSLARQGTSFPDLTTGNESRSLEL